MRLMIVLLIGVMGALPALAADKVKVSATISTNDPAASERLAKSLYAELQKHPELEIDDKRPDSKLIITALRDEKSAKNPNGWSFGVVQVRQNLFQSLNVGHADDLTDANVAAFTQMVTNNFVTALQAQPKK
jgi:hypothetical protein